MTDYYALDDQHALQMARRSIKNLNYQKMPSVSIGKVTRTKNMNLCDIDNTHKRQMIRLIFIIHKKIQ